MFVSVDEQGFETIIVGKEDLQDFEKFIQNLRSQGCGATTGIVKVRLHEDDRNDDVCMRKALRHLDRVLRETCIIDESDGRKTSRTRVPAFTVSKQKTLRGALNDHIYEYVEEMADAFRERYVSEVMDPASYKTIHNCCTDAVAAGLSCARQHFFDTIAKRSPFTPELRRVVNDDVKTLCDSYEPILHGAGVPCPEYLCIPIGDVLDMSKLGTIIDKLEMKFDGIAFPYLYCGTSHSFFCWHIEDGGLASINYVMAGGSKIWYAIAPKYFGLVDHIVQGFRIDKYHTVCRAVLVGHKSVLFDPEFLLKKYGVPYTMVKQDPGDFVITWPFTLHAGFNSATNMAIAVNFADEHWIDHGMYAPFCGCKDEVNVDLTTILETFRPNLLQGWKEAASVTFPSTHPRAIIHPFHLKTVAVNSDSQDSQEAKKRKMKLYKCPSGDCKTVYTDHRNRLKPHTEKVHPNEIQILLERMEERYPSAPRSSSSNQCQVCGTRISGSVSNLERHIKAQLKNAKCDTDDMAKYEEALLQLSKSVKRRKRL